MYNYLLPLILILFSSCQKKAYDEYYSFQNDEWHTDSLVMFKHFVKDTIKPYDISLKIRHNVNYEFQNIFVFLQGEFTDTLELFLANKHGKWLGKGVSDIREKEYIFKKANVFSKKGEHIFSKT